MKLCCFFNYAPLYRQSIYRKIDETFNTQFYFGQEVFDGEKSGIPKIDYSIFKRTPVEFRNKKFFKRFLCRSKNLSLALKKYDTYLITGDLSYSYIPFLCLCKLLNKRVFAWGHGIKDRNGKTRIFNDFIYNNITGYLTYGERGRERLIELGYEADKIEVIYNSLGEYASPTTDLQDDIYKTHFNNEDPVLIFIGRLTPQKKLEWLIRALHRLILEGSPCNLVIVGDGPCMDDLKLLSEQLNTTRRIWFFGQCYDESLTSKMIYNADLCVSPGDVGLTALNAMQFGTPVISHDDFDTQMPEYETIVNGSTGILYRKDDFNDFCAKIKLWLDKNSKSREIVRQNCISMINGKWNSDYQIQVLKKILKSDSK